MGSDDGRWRGPYTGGQVISVVTSGQTGVEDGGVLRHSLLPPPPPEPLMQQIEVVQEGEMHAGPRGVLNVLCKKVKTLL